jgi:hypothetical protein
MIIKYGEISNLRDNWSLGDIYWNNG